MNPSLLRNLIVIFIDLILVVAGLYFTILTVDQGFSSTLTKLGSSPFSSYWGLMNLAYGSIFLVSFLLFKTFQPSWRYIALRDLMMLSYVSVYANIFFLLYILLIQHLTHVPHALRVTSLIINIFIVQAFLAFPRVFYRYFLSERQTGKSRQPAIIFGTLSTNDLFLRYNKTRKDPFFISLVVTTNEADTHVAQKIHGIKVMSFEKFLQRQQKKRYSPETLFIITDPKFVGPALESLFTLAKEQKLETFRVADLDPLKANQPTLRPVDIEDLLGREKVELGFDLPEALIHDKVIMVTGAGGSIGSEIVHQVLHFGPKKVIIIDQCEYFLYELDQSLRLALVENRWVACIADVTDKQAMEALFAQHKPDVVFHAAAMKHVPLSEVNLRAVFENNVIGTWTIATLAIQYKVRSMILISTDKAVNPSNAMGLTKRIAEIICQAFDVSGSRTRFAAVRFGNVLGSRGSVIPLFQKQISRGGPITITDRNMERYFMTIQEAVALVLQAGAFGTLKKDLMGGLFVLDMGQPVKVLKMAERLIELSGYEPYKDISIVFTGIRSGEKLGEELAYKDEIFEENIIPGVHFIASNKSQAVASVAQVEAFIKHVKDLLPHEEDLLSLGYKFIDAKTG